MKLIVVRNNSLQNSFEKKDIIVNTLPDTALLKDGKPFFIPDFANPCTLKAYFAVRICRLGRSISQRFAHRYYDAITVGGTFIADNLLNDCIKKGLPWDLATGFDGATPIGKFQLLYDIESLNNDAIEVWHSFKPLSPEYNLKLTINGKTFTTGNTGQLTNHIDEVIAYISQYYTLRQGDIIFLGNDEPSAQVSINDKIEGYLNDQLVLKFNIK